MDLVASTRHDEFASSDYARLAEFGISAAREGVNWVRAEARSGQYDFRQALTVLSAATANGVRVLWDLAHFGWPDHIDPFRPAFAGQFARYARAFARFLSYASDEPAVLVPINEMSFLAWAGGDVGCMNPFELARGVELKAQLVRATIEAMEAIWDEIPHARFLQPEPLIHIVRAPAQPKTWRRVEADNLLQYQAWDMLCGRVWPALGGHPKYLDVLGVNFYPDNQFMLDGTTVYRGDPRYRPFSSLLAEAWERYGRPMIVTETGSEGESRASWLRYVSEECRTAMMLGCELHGITLYPILNHPGWLEGRHCENGLWDYADDAGQRALYQPLAAELRAQEPLLVAERAAMLAARHALPTPALEHSEASP